MQVKIWFQNRRMKLKKELRAVKEINEQVRREREEQEKMKHQQQDKDKNKETGGNVSNTGSNSPNPGSTTPNNVANAASSALAAGGGIVDTKMAT